MKAILVRQFGGPEVLQQADVPVPVPGPGEVLMRVSRAGVNYADTRQRRGTYVLQEPLPLVPGFEASGTVAAVGPGCGTQLPGQGPLEVGAEILAGDARNAYAEFCIVPADLVLACPEGKSVLSGASFSVSFTVAWLAAIYKGRVRAGQTVLVHAAAGAVGSAVVQLCALAGARVVATASTPRKLERALEAGASVAINYTDGDFREQVRGAFKSERPIDLVIDSVGGDVFVKSLDLLGRGGRLVGIGQASDQPATLDLYRSLIPYHLTVKFLARGSLAGSRHPSDRALLRHAFSSVVEMWGRDQITVADPVVLPLSEAASAHQMVADRSVVGKIVLEV
ncbi:quinone oxidoreductase family protein [Parafrigoribacterium humi]|uniref:quinone oxidoreductase family protein n=1 Tax=Parafrigoribacterium humi TaxID=3144664 RepID=UPI0032EF8E7A